MPSKELVKYLMTIKRYKFPLSCMRCDARLSAKEYTDHNHRDHGTDGSTSCPWCEGRHSWPKGQKRNNAHHLLSCFKQFVETSSVSHTLPDETLPSSPHETTLNSASSSSSHLPSEILESSPSIHPQNLVFSIGPHPYNAKDCFEIQPIPDLPVRAFGLVWPENYASQPITFRDDSLNIAMSYVSRYLETRHTHEWFHLMIKPVLFPSFLSAMDADNGTTTTLVFACWCDGGNYTQAEHRQHRHMIALSPKGHFKNHVWNKVKLSRTTVHASYKGIPCKRSKRILTPMHLVGAIGYVSHRRSRCTFSDNALFDNDDDEHEVLVEPAGAENSKGGPKRKKKDSKDFRLLHFHLFRTLPQGFELVLSMLWKDGLREYLYVHLLQNVPLMPIAESPGLTQTTQGQWKHKIKDLPGIRRGMVLPVSKQYAPAPEGAITEHFLHLLNDRKLYFESSLDNELLEPNVWMMKQAEGGNCFYDVLDGHEWTPRPQMQAELNRVKPLLNTIEQLKTENEQQKSDISNLKRKLEEADVIDRKKTEKIFGLQDELKNMKDDEIDRLKKENKQLKEENEQLKKKIRIDK